MADRHASEIRGLPVIIPDGRLLGTVHDTVIDVNNWSCTHIFVSDPQMPLSREEPRSRPMDLGQIGRGRSATEVVPADAHTQKSVDQSPNAIAIPFKRKGRTGG